MARTSTLVSGIALLAAIPLTLTGCSLLGGNPVPIPTVTVTAAPIEPDKPVETAEPTEPTDDDYTIVFDDTGVVSVNVPKDWTETSGTSITTSTGIELLNVTASPDLATYQGSWDAPGVSVSATQDPTATIDDFVGAMKNTFTEDCGDPEEGEYDDSVYIGTYLYFSGCGDTETDFLAVIAEDYESTHLAVTTIQMLTEDEKSTIRDEILNSFYAIY